MTPLANICCTATRVARVARFSAPIFKNVRQKIQSWVICKFQPRGPPRCFGTTKEQNPAIFFFFKEKVWCQTNVARFVARFQNKSQPFD
jgi:hypothetical protein